MAIRTIRIDPVTERDVARKRANNMGAGSLFMPLLSTGPVIYSPAIYSPAIYSQSLASQVSYFCLDSPVL